MRFLALEPVENKEYIALFVLCLICFLIGWLFSRWYFKKKYKNELDECHAEKERIKRQKEDFIHTGNSPIVEASSSSEGIRAIKTRERSGAVVESSQTSIAKTEPADKKGENLLNFDRFGHADPSKKDDLKRIGGVGPFIENKLNDIGIYTFDQISKFEKEDIEMVTELIKFFPGRIERDDWVGQAKRLKIDS
ncbi:hypothetical protein ACFQ1M_07115 [Sungkyunkwania multivorans]|uniref:Uncharacterized protein n=1 Tax=Sungkyunkwania multivorans TaxID=1173618 RepID=A0ABW3CW25_9FLAO